MRIFELCTSHGHGGLELYALQISRWLKQQGHHCSVVVAPATMMSERTSKLALETIFCKPMFRILPLLAAHRLAKIIDQENVDILHAHWTKDLPLAVLAKKLSSRKPKLVFIRHMAITRHKRDFYHRFIYHSIDRYLVITQQLFNEAKRFLPVSEDKLQLIYHGVADFEASDPLACKQFLSANEIQDNVFRILLPGRIEHYKGQHTLVEALGLLSQQGINVEVVLLGHIMDEAYFKQLREDAKKAGLENKVHYLGFIENPTLFYNCFDVVVLTTYAETFGLVLVEAMKSGVAAIGTNAGGVPEIIEHNKTGMLYQPGDANDLARCLKKMIKDPEWTKKLADAGKKYADDTFSEQQHYTKLNNIFTELTH